MTRRGRAWTGPVLSAITLIVAGCGGGAAARQEVTVVSPGGDRVATYRLYVANESSDVVSRVAYRAGEGGWVEEEVPVGIMPGDIDGAHGMTVSPDGQYWYVTIAHGQPYGTVWKFRAGADSLVGRTTLGLFPATMGVTPDGQFLLAVNFNLHGDMVPSDVSVVYTPSMTEVTRLTTCLMPHGSRVNASGTRHYSACMHSDQLVEIDLETLQISRRFSLRPGAEAPLALDDRGEPMAHEGGEMHAAHAGGDAAVCSPTWAEPGEGRWADRYVYVACNRNGEVLEIDVERWEVTRRFATGRAPYNLEATEDGRYLAATLKGEQAVAFFDLEAGEEVARLPTTQPVTHGVVASPDSRFAFVTNEAVGGTPGTLDVFDLRTLQRVESVELRHQPGGVDFWSVERDRD